MAVDSDGNVALQVTTSVGLTSQPSFSGTANVSLSASNAPNIYETSDGLVSMGGSIYLPSTHTPPLGGGAEVFYVPGADKATDGYGGISLYTGVATSVTVEGHATTGKTWTLFSFNVFSVIDNVCEFLK